MAIEQKIREFDPGQTPVISSNLKEFHVHNAYSIYGMVTPGENASSPEDALVIEDRIIVAADGVGSLQNTDTAAENSARKIAVNLLSVTTYDEFQEIFSGLMMDELSISLVKQNTDTTIACLKVLDDNETVCTAHVGDSRVYAIETDETGTDRLIQLTEDHNIAFYGYEHAPELKKFLTEALNNLDSKETGAQMEIQFAEMYDDLPPSTQQEILDELNKNLHLNNKSLVNRPTIALYWKNRNAIVKSLASRSVDKDAFITQLYRRKPNTQGFFVCSDGISDELTTHAMEKIINKNSIKDALDIMSIESNPLRKKPYLDDKLGAFLLFTDRI